MPLTEGPGEKPAEKVPNFNEMRGDSILVWSISHRNHPALRRWATETMEKRQNKPLTPAEEAEYKKLEDMTNGDNWKWAGGETPAEEARLEMRRMRYNELLKIKIAKMILDGKL